MTKSELYAENRSITGYYEDDFYRLIAQPTASKR